MDTLSERVIRRAFHSKARQCHPDSTRCSMTKELAGIKMKELIDARDVLLNAIDIDTDTDLLSDIWKNGVLDETISGDRIISWLIHSPTVNTMLDSLYVYTQSNSK